jgi:hypothetical protein
VPITLLGFGSSPIWTYSRGSTRAKCRILTAALGILSESDHREGQLRGAIDTGFDPSLLSHRLPGYAWVKDRIQWMKQIFAAFDDAPCQGDPGKRRNPFPAFHYAIRYAIGGGELPLDGVQVLVGHDFVVVHEFSLSLEDLDGIPRTHGVDGERRFAKVPPGATTLFTAAFLQVSDVEAFASGEDSATATRIFIQTIDEPAFRVESGSSDWVEDEFAPVCFPGFNASLRCAMRAEECRYQGHIIVGGSRDGDKVGPHSDLGSRVNHHIQASAYLTFLCTPIVNDAKVQYEYAVAERWFEKLKRSLDLRLKGTREMLRICRADKQPSLTQSVRTLTTAHLIDRDLLANFGRLVDTCRRNTEQFERVTSRLMESNNRWAAEVLKRMTQDNIYLQAAQTDLTRRFDTVQSFLDELKDAAGSGAEHTALSTRPIDPKLRHLRDCLHRQLRECNEYCKGLAESGHRRLFEPSQEALDDLFEYEIHVPVTSARDFRGFITALYWVFDEGLHEKIRRLNPEELPDPLGRIKDVLHADTFKQISTLRHKLAAHDDFKERGAHAAKQLSEVYLALIGDRSILPFNAEAWMRLQTAVLEMLSKQLEQLLQIFGDYQDSMRKMRKN